MSRFALALASLGASLGMVLATAPGAHAQTRLEGNTTFDATDSVKSLALIDVDDNQTLDVVTFGFGINLLTGNGQGTFSHAATLLDATEGEALDHVTGDWNGDGRIDFAAPLFRSGGAFSGTRVVVLLSSGPGTFVPQYFITGQNPLRIETADLDGDLDLDLVILAALSPPRVKVRLNDGNGNFALQSTSELPSYSECLAVGDYTGDQIPDAVVATLDDGLRILVGNGDGTFQTSYPVLPTFAARGYLLRDMEALDANEDGKLDLLTSGSEVRLHLGTGTGAFGAAIVLTRGGFLSLGDLNEDGHVDFTVTREHTARAYVGDGQGGFERVARVIAGSRGYETVIGDIDGDARPDLVTGGSLISNSANHSRGYVLTTLRKPSDQVSFRGPMRISYPGTAWGNATGDFDGDGLTDVIVSGETYQPPGDAFLLRGLQGGGLGAPEMIAAEGRGVISTPDLNGDGVLDLLMVKGHGWQSGLAIYLGSGDGTFSFQSSHSVYRGAVTYGDWDGDGRDELVVARTNSLDVVQSDGFGALWTTQSIPVQARTLASGPLDDGPTLDFVFAEWPTSELRTYMGDGTGSFTAGPVIPSVPSVDQIIVGDFNGNGRNDFVAIGYSSSTPNTVWTHLASGSGQWTTPPIVAPGGMFAQQVTAADVDNDGNLDLIGSGEGRYEVLWGQGDGTFLRGEAFAAPGWTGRPIVLDYDRDGRLDVLGIRTEMTVFTNDQLLVPETFCSATPNSSGGAARLTWSGTTSLAANDLVLRTAPTPPNALGVLFYGPQQTEVPFGNGNLCVTGPSVYRYRAVQATAGVMQVALDAGSLPSGPASALDTWSFQTLFRDPSAGGSGFDLSDGLQVTFGP